MIKETISKHADSILSTVGLMFGFMLIPMLLDSINGNAVNIISSGLTSLGMLTVVITFYSKKLYKSAITNLFTGTMWFMIFIFGIIR